MANRRKQDKASSTRSTSLLLSHMAARPSDQPSLVAMGQAQSKIPSPEPGSRVRTPQESSRTSLSGDSLTAPSPKTGKCNAMHGMGKQVL